MRFERAEHSRATCFCATTTPGGKALFQMIGCFCRIRAGDDCGTSPCRAARARGKGKGVNGIFPYRAQRNVARFGEAKEYGWSEDKARQYAVPEREDFGAYVKRRGFRLEDCALSSSRGASEAVAQTSADRATIRSCLPDESILMLRSRTAGV